jgi:hypothetical protein
MLVQFQNSKQRSNIYRIINMLYDLIVNGEAKIDVTIGINKKKSDYRRN